MRKIDMDEYKEVFNISKYLSPYSADVGKLQHIAEEANTSFIQHQLSKFSAVIKLIDLFLIKS